MDNLLVYGMLTTGAWAKRHNERCRVFRPDGVAPTLMGSCGGGFEPKVVIWK